MLKTSLNEIPLWGPDGPLLIAQGLIDDQIAARASRTEPMYDEEEGPRFGCVIKIYLAYIFSATR